MGQRIVDGALDQGDTAGAQTIQLCSYTLPDNCAGRIQAFITARDVSDPLASGLLIRVNRFGRATGNASFGTAANLFVDVAAALSGIAVTFAQTAGVIRVDCTGLAGKTIHWQVRIEIDAN